MVRVLFLGDIVGRPGRSAVEGRLHALREQLKVDLVVANGENAASGAGINGKIANELHKHGVDGITLGDHVWDQRGFDQEIDDLEFVCRPANLSTQCPGQTYLVLERNGFRLGVLTILGRHFMKISGEDPFGTVDRMLTELKDEADAWLVEVHAEATSEKIAMGWFLDGRAAAVIGTHTHIPTADARVLPRGTGYLTDAGMTGPYESVLGRAIQPVVARFLDGMPRKFDVATSDVRICGALMEIDPKRGRSVSFKRFELNTTTNQIL